MDKEKTVWYEGYLSALFCVQSEIGRRRDQNARVFEKPLTLINWIFGLFWDRKMAEVRDDTYSRLLDKFYESIQNIENELSNIKEKK